LLSAKERKRFVIRRLVFKELTIYAGFGSCCPFRLGQGKDLLFVVAGRAFFFLHEKTSEASLDTNEKIKAGEKTKVSA